MPKSQIFFVCQECGYESFSWLGKCPECQAWNSLKEFHEVKNKELKIKTGRNSAQKPQKLQQINLGETTRILTGFSEADSVLGGGIVPGSVILLAGDPGIGKSTLLLQLALNISNNELEISNKEFGQSDKDHNFSFQSNRKVLYISGEESVEQIKLRATRIKNALNNENFYLISLTDPDEAIKIIEQENPSLVVIDSIQTMQSSLLEGLSGAVGQVRYSANLFINTAKNLNIPIILVGHVTKEGMVAGPMILSHMVDTVLFLEGEKFTAVRLLRSLKNRFGPVDEVGVFEMKNDGINEIKNPEQLFLTKREEDTAGSILSIVMEGRRPFLIEIQALAIYSKLPMPRRVITGIDNKRLELLLAVLQKQCGLNVDSYDIYVNVAGGFKVTDRSVDLGICLAIFSSLKNKFLSNIVSISEVGLLGELRKTGNIEKTIKEAKKLGFKQIITPFDFKNLKAVIAHFGDLENPEKNLRQKDERHFTLD